MNIDDRIQQCKNDIEALKANLTKLEAEKKQTEWNPKFGDVVKNVLGELRLINENFEAVTSNGKSVGDREFVRKNPPWHPKPYSYTKLGNIFEGYQWPTK